MKIKIINTSIIVFMSVISIFGITQNVVFAQAQSTFTTSLSVTGPADLIAPSQPTNLTATAISSSQINLDWDASTDNIWVAGYVVYRDSVAIATTTDTDYVDSSLTASTTYTYYIEAFDYAPNYSIASDSVSTTTFQIIVPPVATSTESVGGKSGSKTNLTIDNLVVTPGMTTSFVSFSNYTHTLAKIYWGITPDLELGSISGVEYSPTHTFKIDDLEMNKLYYLKIEVVDGIGRSTFVLSTFRTLSAPVEIEEVANPQNFTAKYVDGNVKLSWINPQVFDSVIIVRSDKFFPVNVYEGKTIYEGDSESFVDRDVISGKTYYYTLFAKDSIGRLSSGSIASAFVSSIQGQGSQNPFDYLPPANSNDPKILKLNIGYFDFIQDGIRLKSENGDVYIDGSKDLIVSIDYDKLPEVLKTIAVTIYDKNDSTLSFSFLLKVNKDKTKYKAVISALNKEGKFPLSAVIVDYKNRSMKKMNGNIFSSLLHSYEIVSPVVVWLWSIVILFFILIVLLWILVKLIKRFDK